MGCDGPDGGVKSAICNREQNWIFRAKLQSGVDSYLSHDLIKQILNTDCREVTMSMFEHSFSYCLDNLTVGFRATCESMQYSPESHKHKVSVLIRM